jgi:hypothetical protein
LDGLRAANARRIALATAYTDIVERLKVFLQEYGFEVTTAKGLGFEVVPVGGATHGLMNGVRLLGVSPRVMGYGMVFAKA